MLHLTWGVLALPDGPFAGTPEIVRYMWEFALTPAAGEPVLFQAQAKYSNLLDRTGPQTTTPAGTLTGNCTQTGQVITCERIAELDVTFDTDADEITAHVPFSLLVDAAGEPLVVDGTRLTEREVFQGVLAILQTVVSYGAFGDIADVDPVLVGSAVLAGFEPDVGLGGDQLAALLADVVPTEADGSFSHAYDVADESIVPGAYVVAAIACSANVCSPVASAAVEVLPPPVE